jgi:CSLREA domain-containing protein
MKRESRSAIWVGVRWLAKAISPCASGAIAAVLMLVIVAPAQAHRRFSASLSFRPAFASFRTPNGVYTMNVDGSGQALLVAGFRFPRWTTDGSKLSLVDQTTNSLWVAGGDGTGAVKVSGSTVVTTGAISPDGTHVAYIDSNQQTGNQDLIVANSDGSQPTTLLTLSLFHGLAWSPNSQTLIYSGRTGSGPSSDLLFTIPASGGSPTAVPISNIATAPFAQPTYSPNGTTIAFDAISASTTQVFTAPAAGGAATQVTSGVAFAAQPVVSPDGTTILFTGLNQTVDQIYSVPAIGGTATNLTNTTTIEADPAYQPLGQGVSGTLTDPNGIGVPGVQLNVTGTDTLGNPVSTQAFTDINGNYSVSLNTGTYSVSPTQPSNQAQGRYVPTTCSGTVSGTSCQGIVLNAGAQATASFKLVKLIVNSTLDTDDPTQAALGVCDVTPGGPQQTCTLRQAIEVANTLGGGSITFNIPGGGVPTIVAQTLLPGLSTPITIDGTTQPGVGVVTLRSGGSTAGGLGISSTGVTVRGMKIDGFAAYDLGLGEGAGSDLIEDNQIDTVPGLPAPSTAAIDEFLSAGRNTFQQNTVGNAAADTFDPTFNLNDPQDTVGGASPGQGNTVDGGVERAPARILGAGSVIQGNRFNDAILVAGDGATVGGATPTPGAGAGNVISTATVLTLGSIPGMDVGSNDVVQGNQISGAAIGILVYGGHDTIGGAQPPLGNEILGNRTGIGIGLTRFGQTPTPSPGNVVQNNQIIGNDGGDGGVAVYDGIGNHIFENEIDNNHAANINLGGGPYQYNTLSTPSSGPNHYQPYPELLDVTNGSTLTVSAQLLGGLAHAQDTYTVDLYAQTVRCQDSVSEGQAYEWLGSARVRADGIGTASFKMTIARSRAQHLHGPTFVAHPAFTVTATAADGSTSELSPCLTLGRRAPSFTSSGVSATSKTIAVTTTTPAGARDSASATAASARPAAKRPRPTATLRLLCPPVTIHSCSGTFRLATTGRSPITIARRSFRLAPGQVASFALPIPRRLLTSLKRSHRAHVLLAVDARDGARHRHRKRTTDRLTLVLKA